MTKPWRVCMRERVDDFMSWAYNTCRLTEHPTGKPALLQYAIGLSWLDTHRFPVEGGAVIQEFLVREAPNLATAYLAGSWS